MLSVLQMHIQECILVYVVFYTSKKRNYQSDELYENIKVQINLDFCGFKIHFKSNPRDQMHIKG